MTETAAPPSAQSEDPAEAAARACVHAPTDAAPSQAALIGVLDRLYERHGLDQWSDSEAAQDALYDFGGLPA